MAIHNGCDKDFLFMNLRLGCCLFLLVLAGCVAPKKNVNNEVNKCKAICMQHLDYCKQNCRDNCPACITASCRHAAMSFANYVHERKVQGKMITRELNSYRDPLKCRKVTCSCSADFTACEQSCTGVVQKRLQGVLYCI